MSRHAWSRTQQLAHSKQNGVGQHVLCVLCAVCCVLTSGCVYRSLTIRTDPPGALVYVNDELKGHSPLTYDFVWYGWHRVTLRKDGFVRLDDRKNLKAPVYLWIPLDFAMELLPVPIRDARTWSYTLSPAPELPTPKAPAIIPPPGSPQPPPQAEPPSPSTGESGASDAPQEDADGQAR